MSIVGLDSKVYIFFRNNWTLDHTKPDSVNTEPRFAYHDSVPTMKSFCQKRGLELHGCSLRDSGAAASRLYVSVGEKRLALGSVSATRPFCPIRFTSLSPETTFSCEGGELLLSGLVLNDDMHDF